MGLTAIDTPDATTIVFHLQKPFPEFDYVAAISQTRPGPAGQGHRQQLPAAPAVHRAVHVPELPAGQELTLVKNPNWNAATDPCASSWPTRSWSP